MKTLYVQKITRDELIINWKIEKYSFVPSGELFMRSNKKGIINWAKAPLYTWDEITEEQKKRPVKFTLPPDLYSREDNYDWHEHYRALLRNRDAFIETLEREIEKANA